VFSRSHTGKPGLKKALTMIIGGASKPKRSFVNPGTVQ